MLFPALSPYLHSLVGLLFNPFLIASMFPERMAGKAAGTLVMSHKEREFLKCGDPQLAKRSDLSNKIKICVFLYSLLPWYSNFLQRLSSLQS